MQSNAEEVLNHDWSSIVSVFVFPTDLVSNADKKSMQQNKQQRIYKYLKKDMKEVGSGNNNQTVKKHGREIRKGVFQIQAGELSKQVKGCCMPLALLVGKSFLDKDDKSRRLTLNMNVTLDKFYCAKDIYSVYKAAGVGVRSVKLSDVDKFHKNYLSKNNIDLVVFSKQYFDTIVYNSRVDENNRLMHLTNDVIFLWLNDNHYDLILSPRVFLK
jgi:hypothetical protein